MSSAKRLGINSLVEVRRSKIESSISPADPHAETLLACRWWKVSPKGARQARPRIRPVRDR